MHFRLTVCIAPHASPLPTTYRLLPTVKPLAHTTARVRRPHFQFIYRFTHFLYYCDHTFLGFTTLRLPAGFALQPPTLRTTCAFCLRYGLLALRSATPALTLHARFIVPWTV